jgi:murein DD-endopeptidase MepM/ murein hydrolase activator NlpD
MWVGLMLVGSTLVWGATPEAEEACRAGLEAKHAGQLAQAEEALRHAISLDSAYAEPHWVLAWLLAARQDQEGAIAEFQAFCDMEPNEARAPQARTAIIRLRTARAQQAEYANLPSIATPLPGALDPDGVCHDLAQVQMVLPVAGGCSWSDTFLAPRGGGTRRHLGQDLMAPKMAPLVAAFDGVVQLGYSEPSNHYKIKITADFGWRVCYYHVNNDTPGTDDGKGGTKYAFAPGLKSGDRVKAGQLVGYVGDSGNAEDTPPHLHFELWRVGGGVYNAAPSLAHAEHLDVPR